MHQRILNIYRSFLCETLKEQSLQFELYISKQFTEKTMYTILMNYIKITRYYFQKLVLKLKLKTYKFKKLSLLFSVC